MSIWVDANGWPVPPQALLVCLVAEILYFRGWDIIVKGARAKQAARARNRHAVLTSSTTGAYQWNTWFWRGIFFSAALSVFLVASSAPIDILASRLFWVHMVQHLLLMVVVAPLLVASAPVIPLWLGLPGWIRRPFKVCVRLKVRRALYQVMGWLRQPAIACVLLIVGTWAWHWPTLYDLALTNAAIHDWCEHTTFLVVSMLFWSQVLSSPPLHQRLSYLGRIGCILIAMAQNVILAAVLGFSQVPLYAPYAHLVTGPGGLSALQDQQLGAGIMWTFGDLPFGIALAGLIHLWLGSVSSEQGALPVGEKRGA
jgi:cytochrome c oxidase assembly factor CtaG